MNLWSLRRRPVGYWVAGVLCVIAGAVCDVPAASADVPPTITSVSPSIGGAGTTVTVTGTGLSGATGATINGVTCPGFTVASDSQVMFTVPGPTNGSGQIVISTPGVEVHGGTIFRILPIITSFTPTTGIAGSTVTVTGSGFKEATAALIGGASAPSITVVNDTQLKIVVPPGTIGAGPITIIAAAGSATSAASFTALASIETVSPDHGDAGTTVTVSGDGFTGTTGVTVNGTTVADLNKVSDTELTFRVPGQADGQGPVAVITPSGTLTSSSDFEVEFSYVREWAVPAVVLLVITLLLSIAGIGKPYPIGWLGVLGFMLIGADKRWSTSKTMFTLWTYAVAFVLISILTLRTASVIADNGIDGSYLFLLGFPVGAAVIAKQITVTSISNGDLFNADGSPSPNPLIDLTSDNEGKLDLGDFQYVLFNAIALGYFFYLYNHDPPSGLPQIPSTLILLTSVAASAYLGKKALQASGVAPVITATESDGAAKSTQFYFNATHVTSPSKPLDDSVNETVRVTLTPLDPDTQSENVEGALPPIPAANLGGSSEVTVVTFMLTDEPGDYNLRVQNYVGVMSNARKLTITD